MKEKIAVERDEFVLVSSSSGDWEGLYKNGRLIVEDHNISTYDIFKIFGILLTEKEADEGWLESEGSLPKNLSDVQF